MTPATIANSLCGDVTIALYFGIAISALFNFVLFWYSWRQRRALAATDAAMCFLSFLIGAGMLAATYMRYLILYRGVDHGLVFRSPLWHGCLFMIIIVFAAIGAMRLSSIRVYRSKPERRCGSDRRKEDR